MKNLLVSDCCGSPERTPEDIDYSRCNDCQEVCEYVTEEEREFGDVRAFQPEAVEDNLLGVAICLGMIPLAYLVGHPVLVIIAAFWRSF